VIGTYDDFVLTALSLQNNSTVFIDKTQKERKDLLAQFMGMGIFDLLYTRASEEINEVSAVLRNFNRTDYDVELSDLEKQNKQYEQVQTDLRNQKKSLTDRRTDFSNQVIQMTKKLKPIDESIMNIDKLESGRDLLEEELLGIDTRMGSLVGTQQDNKTKIKEFKRKINTYSDDDVNGKYLQLTHYQEHKKEIKVDIDKLKIEVKNKLDKIEKLGNLEWDDNCDYCMSNPFTLDAISTKESLDSDKGLAREKLGQLDGIDDKISDLKDYHDKKVDYDRSVEALRDIEISQNRLDSESTLLKEKKKTTLLKIKQLEEKIQKYNDSETDIEYNNKVENDIDKLKNKIDDLEYQIDTIDSKIQTAHAEIQVNETKKKTILDTMNEVQDLETKYEAYKYYMDAIKRDGVPYELIEKALPTIEGEVNDILSQMVDFGIVLEMDGKNINTYLTYDEDNIWPLELSSGMERFISSLAIRVGLINVCNLPRPNFLAIDEGFGNMDSDNLNSVYMLFQYLKSQFQFCFIVSHIESMRDTVDSLLEIKKEKGFSQILYYSLNP
jgi:DNA repair exonuclease SbcCD ATPase subunit